MAGVLQGPGLAPGPLPPPVLVAPRALPVAVDPQPGGLLRAARRRQGRPARGHGAVLRL